MKVCHLFHPDLAMEGGGVHTPAGAADRRVNTADRLSHRFRRNEALLLLTRSRFYTLNVPTVSFNVDHKQSENEQDITLIKTARMII